MQNAPKLKLELDHPYILILPQAVFFNSNVTRKEKTWEYGPTVCSVVTNVSKLKKYMSNKYMTMFDAI